MLEQSLWLKEKEEMMSQYGFFAASSTLTWPNTVLTSAKRFLHVTDNNPGGQ